MVKKFNLLLVALLLSLFVQVDPVTAADNSTIQGSVLDAQTGDPLPSASVVLVGTSFGAATDMNGMYTIRNVPPGSYSMRVSYIGYRSIEDSIEVRDGETVNKLVKLEAVAVQGEVVTVTAQARGQKEAINEQLASQQIVNVVSSARIQELPDANAAESIGRLPGVSLLRNGGEGSEVVIRGLQPKYNKILVDGVRMSSSNENDRSTDLSMISPNMLEGIEVSKSVTPDQDADVLGGTVNFKLREAKSDQKGLGVGLLAQGGYNGLSNAPNKYNNYKYVGSIEGRFFDQALGVFVQGDLERRNLTSNELVTKYAQANNALTGNPLTDYQTQTITLNTVPRDRQRKNATVLLDYELPEGKITLANFVSSGTTENQNRGETYDIVNSYHDYSLAYSKSTLNMITNALNVEEQLPIFHANLKLSHSYSETKDPDDWNVNFRELNAGNGSQKLTALYSGSNLDPREIPQGVILDTNTTYLQGLTNTSSYGRERALTASLDFDATIDVSNEVSAVIKFGGKYRHQTRSYLSSTSGSNAGLESTQGAATVDGLIASHFQIPAQYGSLTTIPISYFMDPNFSYGKFLNGDFQMHLPLNVAKVSEMASFVKDALASGQLPSSQIGYFNDQFNSTTNNYSGFENQGAFYAMATINVGTDMTIIPGVRYQDLQTTYSAPRGHQSNQSLLGGVYDHYDTTLTADHAYWLPDVNVRYKPLSWFDVRLSYTNTIAYPDYNAIIPRIDFSPSIIAYNNYQLVPSRSTNYDAYVSFYDNTIGLFTVGGFLKQIDNLIYAWSFYVSGASALPYLPPGYSLTPGNGNINVNTFVNNTYKVNNYGMEFDWQTHFWYLPSPLDGLVLNANYTHIFSLAQYPFSYLPSTRGALPIDTSFVERLLDQPNNIVNLSVGYDYKGFSIRVSMLYQANVFNGPQFWPQLRTSTAAYKRWDIAVKQDLPWFGLQLFADINNINGVRDLSVLNMYPAIPQSAQSYDLTADVGLRWQL